jgi:hypothetical protein
LSAACISIIVGVSHFVVRYVTANRMSNLVYRAKYMSDMTIDRYSCISDPNHQVSHAVNKIDDWFSGSL